MNSRYLPVDPAGPPPTIRPFGRIGRLVLDRGLEAAFVLLGLCLLAAFLASLAVPLGHYLLKGDFSWLPGFFLYGLVFAGLAWGLSRTGTNVEARVVWGIVGVGALLKLGVVLAAAHLPLNTDQSIFRMFVATMADNRLAAASMERLSAVNDFRIWAGRALPVHLAVRWLVGTEDLFWVRIMNVGVSSAMLAVTYWMACRLLPRGRRKWPVFLLMALPFQTYVTTDYSHHLLSSFYLLLGTACVWEMAYSRPRLPAGAGFSLTAGLCLLLMVLQRGVHLIAFGAWAGILGWALFNTRRLRHGVLLLLGGILIPVSLTLPVARGVDGWLRQHDRHQLSSILPAFVARGWCPETDGEYCGRYEQIDRATPQPERAAAMWRLVASQIRHNPGVVCFRFPVVKTMKLFLVGYASNLEESLALADSRALVWARGLRLAAAPLFLGCSIWGCLLMASGPPGVRNRWLAVALVPLLTWGAYVFMGETSPRYSIFCQPFLALLGAWAWPGRPQLPGVPGRGLLKRVIPVLALLGMAMTGLVLIARWMPESLFYADLQQGWSVRADHDVREVIRAGRHPPFEAALTVPPGDLWEVDWTLPCAGDSCRTVTLYVLEADPGLSSAELSIQAGEGPSVRLSLGELYRPRHVHVPVPSEAGSLLFRVTDGDTRQSAGTGGRLHIGYVACRTVPADE